MAKRRQTDPEAEAHLSEILAYSSSTLLQIANLLTPFLPTTARDIRNMFENGTIPADIKPLFPKIYLHTPDPRGAKTNDEVNR